jgi:hypothetical protein
MDDYLEIIRHDAFRYGGGLNKSAGEVYWWLTQAPMTASELIQTTGRSRTTIFRCLQRLARVIDGSTGEVVSLVASKNGVWNLVTGIDLDLIALLIGTAGIGKRKRAQYRKEQLQHKNDLRRGNLVKE